MPDAGLLQAHEADLAEALLPDDPDPSEPLGDSDRFRTHAYLVLACAVIEEHIEMAFRDFVATCAARDDGAVAGCFVTLAAKYGDLLTGQKLATTAATAVPTLEGYYNSKLLKPNNGIKKRNLDALARPLGLGTKLEDECEELLSALDALGAKRGAVAHLGTVEEEIRPGDARALVVAALDKLSLLDGILVA